MPCACFFIFPCSLPFAFYGKWCFLSSTDLKVMSIFVLQVISSLKKYIWGKKRLNASLWDAKAGTSWMIRLPSQVPRPYCLAVYMLICCVCFVLFFFETLYECIPIVLTRHKLCWNHASPEQFLRVISQSNLGGCLLGYSPQFGSKKTLFYFYYRLFIDYFCQYYLSVHWKMKG